MFVCIHGREQSMTEHEFTGHDRSKVERWLKATDIGRIGLYEDKSMLIMVEIIRHPTLLNSHRNCYEGCNRLIVPVWQARIYPGGLYPGLKRPRLDNTRVYYGLGQFIPRGILWPMPIYTPGYIMAYRPIIHTPSGQIIAPWYQSRYQ